VPATSADGKWVVYVSEDAVGKPTLFRVPVLGGAPERIAELPYGLVPGVVTFSPDNKQVLAEITSAPLTTLWVLENYIQSTK
jgi:Tol biopolymer transport system component